MDMLDKMAGKGVIMIKVGFIGYGSMGSMLVNGFLSSGRINADEVIVSTRTASKLETLKANWTDINLAQNNTEVARKAKYIFLCVKPLEMKGVLNEIKAFITPETHIISIAGTVMISNIEKIAPGKVTKMIPSINAEAKDGITLVCHNRSVPDEDAAFVEYMLNGISKVKIVEEDNMDVAVDLTSCAPGFIASIFQEFVNAAVSHGNLSKADAEAMVTRTLYGVSKLFCERNMSFEDVMSRVALKGGITEEGIIILRSGLPGTFDKMFSRTLSKREKLKEMSNADFNS